MTLEGITFTHSLTHISGFNAGSINNLGIPDNFISDSLTVSYFNITRDNGDASLAEDWVALCGLDLYSSENVNWVGLFIDDSGSMRESNVAASKTKFLEKLAIQGIQVKQVVNGNENWIHPFLTKLSPIIVDDCVTGTGVTGHCLDESECIANGKYPVPFRSGDPEPNCQSLPANIKCCIEPDCMTGDGAAGVCLDESVGKANGLNPISSQVGDPEPNCYTFPVNIQCCVRAYCFLDTGVNGICMDESACRAGGKTPVPRSAGDLYPSCFFFPPNIQCCT